MQSLKCSLVFMLILGLCHWSTAMPSVRVKRQDDLATVELEDKDGALNPINAEDVSDAGLERNKRKLPDATFEAKNAVLGFVFGLDIPMKVKNIRQSRQSNTGGAKGKNDDVPEFDRTMVSLDFPGELLNKSFQTLTNVSKSVSRLIMNSARRYSRFMLFFKPIFGDALVIKGSEDPTTTSTTTTTTTEIPSDSLNEI